MSRPCEDFVVVRRLSVAALVIRNAPTMAPRWLSALLLALVVAAAIGDARADRLRFRLGVQPLYALSFVDRRQPSGGGVGMDFSYGVTDSLAVRLSGFVAFHAADGLVASSPSGGDTIGASGTLSSFGAFAGVTYALNVLRIVPSFDLGIGALGLRGDARFGPNAALLPSVNALAVELGFGTDWLITRRWSVGFVVRYHLLLTELERAPNFLYLGPRASITFP